jgi:hypothetical protein
MATKKKSGDRDAPDDQIAAADELQRQIDAVVRGDLPPSAPGSLRDFINEKMAERARKKPKKK